MAGALALAGCGRKGDPVPPIDKREPVKEQSAVPADKVEKGDNATGTPETQ